jgi:hypothetical protein
MNVVEPILFQARNDPPAPAMCAPGTSLGIISYVRLARFIHSIGHRAIRLGIAPNAVVAIQVKDNIFHAAIALGLMHIGMLPFRLAPRFHRIYTWTSFSLIPLKLSPMDETQRSSYSRFFSSYRLGSGGDFGHMISRRFNDRDFADARTLQSAGPDRVTWLAKRVSEAL